MKHGTGLWSFAGFALTSLGGTLLHFVYDLTGGSLLVAPFSGVNESTWEHMKLLYWPLLLFAAVQRRFFRDSSAFWRIKLTGTLVGLALIPALFYTYNGAVGPSPDWLNIAIFFVADAAVFFIEWRLLRQNGHPGRWDRLALAALGLLGALFILFTFFPPPLPLFRDPVTGGYGRM